MLDEQWLADAVRSLDALINGREHREIVERMRASAPVAFCDQIEAATAEAARYADDAIAAGIVKSKHRSRTQDNPVWLRYALLESLIVWTVNSGTTCTHSPSPRAPQPVFAVLWRPRLMVCARCTPMLSGPGLSAQNRTCPGCQRIVAGPGTDDRLYLRSVQSGALTFTFAVCAACRYWRDAPDV